MVVVILLISRISFGQTINFQAGTSISKLNWNLKGINIDPIYQKTLIGYSVFAGVDYIEKKYCNLSSNIGIIRKGGKGEFQLTDQNAEYTGETKTVKPTLDYLSLNTLIQLKYKIKEKITPFISIGPRFEYLYRSSNDFDGLQELDELKGSALGLLLGGGIKYEFSKLQIGLRSDYYLNFTKVAEWSIQQAGIAGEVTVNTFTINMTVGYKLK